MEAAEEKNHAALSKTVSRNSRAECLRLMDGLLRPSLVAEAGFALVVLAVLWSVVERAALLAWFVAVVLAAAASLAINARLRSRHDVLRHLERWERTAAAQTAAHGLAWGALAFFELPGFAAPEQQFLILAVCLIGLGSAGLLSASRPAFYCFLFPALGPLALSLVISGDATRTLAGSMVTAMLLFLVGLHDLLHRTLRATIVKRFESDALAQEQQVIFETAAEAICFVKPHFLAKCNRRFADLLGYTMEELVGRPSWTWHASYEDWRRLATAAEPVIRAGRAYTRVMMFRRKDGSTFWGEITGRAVDPANLSAGMVWMGEDITERLHTEAALKASEERFRRLVSLSSDWYWEQDTALRFTRISGSVFQKAAGDGQAPLGRRLWEIEGVSGVSAEQWRAHREQLEARQPFRDFVYEFRTARGDTRWFSASGNPVFDAQGHFVGYHGVGSDITDRVRGAERYRHLAYHDMLTGLPNRRLFADRLEQALARARRKDHRVAVMLLDLDDFKIINDTHGHSAGDEVLVAIGDRLRAAVRESDTVARLGGDEFVVLLPEAALSEDAETVGRKIIDTIREPVNIGGRQYVLGVSIGLALFPDHGESAERLLQQADIAMYITKRQGGSGLHFAVDTESRPPAQSAAGAFHSVTGS